jgi:hypothetical protein
LKEFRILKRFEPEKVKNPNAAATMLTEAKAFLNK